MIPVTSIAEYAAAAWYTDTLSVHLDNDPRNEATLTAPDGAEPVAEWAARSDEPARVDGLARGDKLDRYAVVEHIGAGGRGDVYRAYDPELDRFVAVKLVRADREQRADEQQRIQREARLIAKLEHPNVVRVYDVGVSSGQLFIVMELIGGGTAADWLRSGEHSADRILEVFRAAGEGLRAAHARGLIHRDIKPSNILIGNDGRVCVADFGLARTARPQAGERCDEQAEVAPADQLGLADSVSNTITVAGAVLGSPAYMAPEQRVGGACDARTDQFSFCVSLYEAFLGKRPQRAADGAAVVDGPALMAVPARVRGALLRGLAAKPDDRFASMDELLAALKPPSRRAWWAAAGAAVVVAGAAAVAVAGGRADQTCTGAASEWARVWNAQAATHMKAGFLATEQPYAADTFERVAALLDGYGAGWRETRTAVCEATFVAQTASGAAFDLKQRCLERRLEAVRLLVEVWSAPDSVDNVVMAATSLAPSSDCQKDAALAKLDLPDEPERRARVEVIEAGLAKVEALQRAGRYADADRELAETQRLAVDLEHARTRAHVELWQSRADRMGARFDAAVAAAGRAIEWAASAGADDLEAEAWLEKRFVLAEDLHNYPAVDAAEEATRLAVRRTGDEPTLVAKLEGQQGTVHYLQAHFEQARQHSAHALELYTALVGSEHPHVAFAENNLGNALDKLGRHEEAAEHHRRGLAIKIGTLGAQHPSVATSHNNLGLSYMHAGKFAEAREQYEMALAIRETALGPAHPLLAVTLGSIAGVFEEQGDLARALEYHRRALAIREAVFGADHPKAARSLGNIAVILHKQGRETEALELAERAYAIQDRAYGAEHPLTSDARYNLAVLLTGAGRFAEARDLLERSVAILGDGEGVDAGERGTTRLALAKALWGVGGQRRRALALAADALRDLETGHADPADVDEARRWLAAPAHSLARVPRE